jgi:hypothetical protein
MRLAVRSRLPCQRVVAFHPEVLTLPWSRCAAGRAVVRCGRGRSQPPSGHAVAAMGIAHDFGAPWGAGAGQHFAFGGMTSTREWRSDLSGRSSTRSGASGVSRSRMRSSARWPGLAAGGRASATMGRGCSSAGTPGTAHVQMETFRQRVPDSVAVGSLGEGGETPRLATRCPRCTTSATPT